MSYIVVRGPSDPHPSSPAQYLSLELAIRDAELLVTESGIDREVWTAMPYSGIFVGMECVRYLGRKLDAAV